MTITTTAAAVTYQGNGAATAYPYGFEILQASHAVVTIVDATVSPPTTTTVSPSLYSITGIGNANGGSVTYPLSGSPLIAGQYLTIQRVVPYVQPTSLTNQGGFYPASIEAALDYLTQQTQQLAGQQARSLQVSVADPGGAPAVLPVASLRANQYLLFDASGNPIAGGVSSGGVAINAAMYGLVQAGSTAAARTALGLPNPAVGTAGYMIRFDATGTVYETRSPAQVLADIGANSASNLSTGTLPDARLSATAKLQQAKAWVRFHLSGTTVVIDASYNVSSVTRNGVGDYTVNFTSAMGDANYVAAITMGSGASAGTANLGLEHGATTMTTTAFRLQNAVAGVGISEAQRVSATFFGN